MRYQLKRIDPWSACKITFLIAGAVGFLVGALYAVMITLMASFVGMMGMSEGMPEEMGYFVGATGFLAVVAWIVITVLYAVIGALVVSLATWLYNLLAGAIGGVYMTFENPPSVLPEPSDATPPATDASTSASDTGGSDPQSIVTTHVPARTRSLRPQSHRAAPHRQRPHGPVQLALRPQGEGPFPPPHRRHRHRPLPT